VREEGRKTTPTKDRESKIDESPNQGEDSSRHKFNRHSLDRDYDTPTGLATGRSMGTQFAGSVSFYSASVALSVSGQSLCSAIDLADW